MSILALFITIPAFATDPDPLAQKTVASKAYVDTKQDIIETGNVMFWDDPEGTEGDMYVPGLVAYDSQTNALSGNKIGILDYETIYPHGEGDLSLYSNSGGYGSEMDNFVPTVRAVAEALQNILYNMPASWQALPWSVNDDNGVNRTNAINAYNSTFGNGTSNWAGNIYDLINGQFLANSLALKQNKIAQSGKQYAADGRLVSYNENSSAVSTSWLSASVKGTGLVTKTATNGVVGERKIFEASDVTNYHATGLTQNQKDIQDISIPTVGAMMTAITNSITAAAPSGTANTLANYDSTGALGTGVATYDGSTTYDSTNDASKVAIMSAVQRKKECGGYETGHENDPDYCWLWILPD